MSETVETQPRIVSALPVPFREDLSDVLQKILEVDYS